MSVGFINYDGIMNSDGFDTFINEFNAVKDNDKIVLFLTTNGGDISIVHNMYSAIVNCEKPVEICISEECSSGGFILLAMLKGKVQLNISSSAWAVIHLIDTRTTMKERKRTPEQYDMFELRQNRMDDELVALFNTFNFTEKEMKTVCRCKDLCVDGTDIKRILGIQ